MAIPTTLESATIAISSLNVVGRIAEKRSYCMAKTGLSSGIYLQRKACYGVSPKKGWIKMKSLEIGKLTMNRALRLGMHSILWGCMFYALVAIVSKPAAACTASDCATIVMNASVDCQALRGFQCTVAHVVSCDARGAVIQCDTPDGDFCGDISGQCN